MRIITKVIWALLLWPALAFGQVTATPTSTLQWSEAAPDLPTAQGYTYTAYSDEVAGSAMVPLFTDPFTRANATTLGATWTRQGSGDIGIVSNQARFNGGSNVGSLQSGVTTWTGTSDQYAEARIQSLVGGREAAIGVRGAGTGSDASARGYYFILNEDNAAAGLGSMRVGIWVNTGAWAQKVTAIATVAANDLIRLEVRGQTLTALINGVAVLTTTDSTLTSGVPFVFISSLGTAATTTTWDTFAAGSPVPVATAILSGVTCTGTVSPFACQALMPPYAIGPHSLTLTAKNSVGETLKSLPLAFTEILIAVPAVPTTLSLSVSLP